MLGKVGSAAGDDSTNVLVDTNVDVSLFFDAKI